MVRVRHARNGHRLGWVRVVLAGGVLLAATASLTAAAITDRAGLNLGSGADSSGVGSLDRFDIGVVTPTGTVEQADGPAGYDWTVSGAETLVPGHEVTTVLPVFNNAETFGADTTMTVVLRNGDGRVSDSVPNITSFLRFSAKTSDGTVLFADARVAGARAALGVLAPRGTSALAQGDTFVAGAAGSSTSVTLTIRYVDEPGVEKYNGGQSAVAVTFAASSVKP